MFIYSIRLQLFALDVFCFKFFLCVLDCLFTYSVILFINLPNISSVLVFLVFFWFSYLYFPIRLFIYLPKMPSVYFSLVWLWVLIPYSVMLITNLVKFHCLYFLIIKFRHYLNYWHLFFNCIVRNSLFLKFIFFQSQFFCQKCNQDNMNFISRWMQNVKGTLFS